MTRQRITLRIDRIVADGALSRRALQEAVAVELGRMLAAHPGAVFRPGDGPRATASPDGSDASAGGVATAIARSASGVLTP